MFAPNNGTSRTIPTPSPSCSSRHRGQDSPGRSLAICSRRPQRPGRRRGVQVVRYASHLVLALRCLDRTPKAAIGCYANSDRRPTSLSAGEETQYLAIDEALESLFMNDVQ